MPPFKFAVDYDGDDKDLEEYVLHDFDDEGCQRRLLAHFSEASRGSLPSV